MILLIPFWWIPIATVIAVLISIEIGYRVGVAVTHIKESEKESPVSVISGAILGLLSFLLAFTFGILYNRFDARKELVRREANAIETTWLRTDFMPQEERRMAVDLLKKYLTLRLKIASTLDSDTIENNLRQSELLQRQLWNQAVRQAMREKSPWSFQYTQSVNDMIEIQNLRIARGYMARTPTGLWISLYSLLVMSMVAIGYQTAIAGSRRTLAIIVLTVSFTLVFMLLFALEQPRYGYFRVAQHPLVNVQKLINQHDTSLYDALKAK